MQRLLVYSPKTGLVKSPLAKEISSYLKEKDIIWLDIKNPQEADYKLLKNLFDVHAIVVEEMKTSRSLPKIFGFPDLSFIIWQALSYGEGKTFATPCLYLLVGAGYLVTVRKEEIAALDSVFATCEKDNTLFKQGAGMILATLFDALIDEYFIFLDTMSDRIDLLEDKMFGEPTQADVRELFSLKRQMLVLRKAAAPEREIINAVLRRDLPFVQPTMEAYYEDLYDHLVRVIDMIDTFRDVSSGAMEIYLSSISNRLNVIMKTLTVIATIMMPLTLIVGIYGMNFKYIPELQWRYSYFVVLGVMFLIAFGMLYWFRRRKWL